MKVALEHLPMLFYHRMHSNILGEHMLFLFIIFFKMSTVTLKVIFQSHLANQWNYMQPLL